MTVEPSAIEALRIERSDGSADRGAVRRHRAKAWVLTTVGLIFAAAAAAAYLVRPVEVVTVRAESAPSADAKPTGVLNASGYVVARRMATVSSKVTGKVVEILVEEGNRVEKDQLLARLDDSIARAAADMAGRELDAARGDLAELAIRLEDAERQLARMQSLRANALVSESALDTARVEARSLRARLDAKQAHVLVSASAVKLRAQDLADLDIHAPFAGVVISKDAQPGETVSPTSGGGAFTRTGIATIVDMESLEIEVDVNESYISRVSQGQRVDAMLDAYPNDSLPARVINIVPTANRQKATVSVRIAFEKLDARLLPDMGVKVRFLDEAAPPATAAAKAAASVRIPTAAVVRDAAGAYVWVVREGRAARQDVVLGAERGGRTELKSGIRPGEELIAPVVEGLREGSAVRVTAL